MTVLEADVEGSPAGRRIPASRALLAGALLVACLGASPAAAVNTCRSQNDGTWSGEPPFTAGTVVWLCIGDGGGPPTAADNYLIRHHVTIEGQLASPAAPIEGTIVVEGRLDLSASAPVSVWTTGRVIFRPGSEGRWQGFELAPHGVPPDVSFPSPTAIRMVFDDASLPWAVCDPAGPGATCDAAAVHPPDVDPGEAVPATQLYFDFEKLVPTAPTPDTHRPIQDWLVDAPGLYLPVSAVADDDGDGNLDTLVLSLPDSGARFGAKHFGSDGEGTIDPLATQGRCEECFEQGVPATTCGGTPGAGRFTTGDTSGCRLRNAVGERHWQTSPTTPWRYAWSELSELRYEILVGSDAFDASAEFVGYLFCVPDGSDDWCARIVDTVDGGGPGGEDVVVVLRDPAGAVAPGTPGAVYYARPMPGDRIVPVNLHYWNGGAVSELEIEEDSRVGVSEPIRAVHLDQLERIVAHNPSGWAMDLALLEHFGTDEPGNNIFLTLTTEFGTVAEVDGLDLRRISCRMPDQDIVVDNDQGDIDGAECIKVRTSYPAGQGPNPDVWRGVTFRKIRGDAISETININHPAFDACPDGLLVQDLVVLHKMMAHVDTPNWDRESLELRGGHRDCAMDRILFAGSASGSDIIVRCENCEPGFGIEISSVVCLTKGAGTGLGNCAAASPSAADHATMTNWLSTRKNSLRSSYRYGSLVGHFGSNDEVAGCQDAIGLYAVGGAPPERWASPCDNTRDVRWSDNAWFFQSRGESQWIRAESGYPGPASLRLDRILFHVDADADDAVLLRHVGGGGALALDFASGLLQTEDVEIENAFYIAPLSIVDLRIGPEVFASGDLHCAQTAGGSAVFRGLMPSDVCAPMDGFALDGDGSDEGWNRTVERLVDLNPRGVPYRLPGPPSPLAYSPAAAPCLGGDCPLADALPRWAGPVAYDWPLVWATAQPLPGLRRAAPDWSDIPAVLAARMEPACDDGVDDDGDGLVDLADAGCSAADDLSERSFDAECDDGVDNDGDGFSDYRPGPGGDPGCASPAGREAPACQDGLDNDLDGRVDFDGGASVLGVAVAPVDPQCQGPTGHEGERCGLGPGLAPVVGALLWLRRRRRRAPGA